MPPWRARAYHLTRSRDFLAKSVAVILGVSALIAAVGNFRESQESGAPARAQTPFPLAVEDGVKRLTGLTEPAPGRLIVWFREMASRWLRQEQEQRTGFDALALRLGNQELHPLITQHTTSDAQAEAVSAYVRFLFLADGEPRRSALQALGDIAKNPTPPHAGEMLGDVLLLSERSEEALVAYLRDIGTPTAMHARRRAFDLAVRQKDTGALERLCDDRRVLAEVDPVSKWRAAKLTGDRRLLFAALWQMQWSRWFQGAAAPLIALFAAAIWYVILIHTGSREPVRWWRYLGAVLAGIASVWLLHWWQGTLDYRTDPETAKSMTHEILGWIMHVGLPEEAAKLVCFAAFLPVLLHHRSSVKAALTAGCVGLGFALDENLHYFGSAGPEVAVGRLLTANFMHLSLTGILGWHLYELFRSRFHHATEFLAAFCIVVAAHGFYDFSLGGSAGQWGMDIAGFVILALAARHYLHLLHDETLKPAGYMISRTALFCYGVSLLGGILMIVLTWKIQDLRGITTVLKQLASLALVALIYIREWKEVH